MPGAYDAVVIGGGHNGLVAATYLARAGRRVLVLEQRASLGGAVTTEEIHPGFRAPTGAALCGLLRHEIVDELELVRYGLSFVPFEPAAAIVGEGGKALRLWHDVRKAQFEIGRLSAADAAAYPRFLAFMGEVARILDPLLLSIPPSIEEPTIADGWFLLGRALKLRRLGRQTMYEFLRMPPMSLHEYLGEWFEGELLKASLSVDALSGMFRGPWSPGTAFGLVHHFLAAANRGTWAFVRGGSATLANALAAAAQASGVTIRTGSSVRRILSPDGRASGVELSNGETVAARAVLSTADPKRTFLKLADPLILSADFITRVRNYHSEGCVSKVNLALDAAPQMPFMGGGGFAPHVQVAPSQEYIERAYDDAKHGGVSSSPVLDVTVPTAVDASLAPAGKHIVSVLVQYTPYHLKQAAWADRRAALGERVLDLLEPHIPNVRSALLAVDVETPEDLEARFGLTGGHIFHGEMTLDQQFVLRPVPGWGRYRTPIPGLYLCGAGTHPGGGITGAPGYNGAHAVLEDWPSLVRGA
ncbi:MAG TPA: NAD(P)/FAD-dependent oxidoreductase [Thermoplasmata archaeon]|nr:NAD(P)/FAD-dependent oxidoreductase [Thermoplasmata archaeon]